jgi:hypothetical protein
MIPHPQSRSIISSPLLPSIIAMDATGAPILPDTILIEDDDDEDDDDEMVAAAAAAVAAAIEAEDEVPLDEDRPDGHNLPDIWDMAHPAYDPRQAWRTPADVLYMYMRTRGAMCEGMMM